MHPETPRRSRSKTLIRADKKKCLYTHTAEAFQRRYFRIDFRNWERSRSSATSSDKLRKDIEKSALKGFCPCAGGRRSNNTPPDAARSHPDQNKSRRMRITDENRHYPAVRAFGRGWSRGRDRREYATCRDSCYSNSGIVRGARCGRFDMA